MIKILTRKSRIETERKQPPVSVAPKLNAAIAIMMHSSVSPTNAPASN